MRLRTFRRMKVSKEGYSHPTSFKVKKYIYKQKKDLWVLYHKALEEGISAEEITNTLFWAVKNLALMKSAPVGDDPGMSPFAEKKSRAAFLKILLPRRFKICPHQLREFITRRTVGESQWKFPSKDSSSQYNNFDKVSLPHNKPKPRIIMQQCENKKARSLTGLFFVCLSL